ncbi:hypothetical protein BaRGS_00007095, partial [Batillaria attramentaria]
GGGKCAELKCNRGRERCFGYSANNQTGFSEKGQWAQNVMFENSVGWCSVAIGFEFESQLYGLTPERKVSNRLHNYLLLLLRREHIATNNKNLKLTLHC